MNWPQIQAKIDEYLKSPEGKDRIREAEFEIIINSRPMKDEYDIISYGDMEHLANTLIEMIIRNAYEYLPTMNAKESVGGLLDGLKYTSPKSIGHGYYSVRIHFVNENELYRPSLEPNKYPDGAYDIVGLFERGYETSGHSTVRGMWHGEETISKPVRPALNFMQDAVDEFNNIYSRAYDVRATMYW